MVQAYVIGRKRVPFTAVAGNLENARAAAFSVLKSNHNRTMDEAGVDKALLSFGAGFRTFGVQGILDRVEAQNTARTVNDFLAEQVREHPTRYIGMATLALQDPDQAARELERCVTKLGFNGERLYPGREPRQSGLSRRRADGTAVGSADGA